MTNLEVFNELEAIWFYMDTDAWLDIIFQYISEVYVDSDPDYTDSTKWIKHMFFSDDPDETFMVIGAVHYTEFDGDQEAADDMLFCIKNSASWLEKHAYGKSEDDVPREELLDFFSNYTRVDSCTLEMKNIAVPNEAAQNVLVLKDKPSTKAVLYALKFSGPGFKLIYFAIG